MALTKISRSLLDTGISDSSDATAITIDSSENVLVGSGTSNGISGGTTGLQVAGAGFSGIISATRHDNNAYGSGLMLGKSRNTTVGSNTIVQDGDSIGAVGFFADDGTNLDSQVAYITASIDGTPGANDTPGRLTFSTTADGAASVSERMRIDSSGNVGIGTTTINSGTLGTSNTFLEVSAGTSSGSGTLVLSRDTSTNNVELGGVRFVNANNADDDGLDADGKLVAAISARSVTSDSNAGDDSGADLVFYTKPEAGNYAERLRINSSGNVGMGGRLSVGTTTTGGGNTKIVATGGTDNYLQLVSNTGSGGVSLGNAGSVFLLYTHTGALGSESFSERMRIDSSGYLYVGTTSRIASGTVNVENVGAANCFTAEVSNNDYYNFAGNNSSGTTTFYVQGDGDYYFSGTSQSDRDLKENIQPINESSLAKVKLLEPKTFNFKESEGYATNTKTGFIAQEVAEIFGTETGVASGTDGKKDMGVDTTGIVAHLTKAIQEQQEQIEALQSEINTLKGG